MNGNTFIPPGVTPKGRGRDIALKSFAVVGLVAILLVAGWAGAKAAQRVPSGLSAVLGAFGSVGIAGERIDVTVSPVATTTPETFEISWKHLGKKEDGSYTFRYDCHDGLRLAYVTASGTEDVFCNVPFNVMTTDNMFVVEAATLVAPRVETTVAIDFTKNGAAKVHRTGEATLLVSNPALAPEDSGTTTPALGPDPLIEGAATTTPTPQPPVVTAGPRQTQTFNLGTSTVPVGVSDPSGTPDLVIAVLDTGTADSKGNFTHKTIVETNDVVAVKFEVRNGGTKSTGPWKFEADLPTRPSRTFTSPVQQSLLPNERIEYVISFDRVKRDETVTVRIELDPDNTIKEVSERNNNVSQDIKVDA